MEACFIDSNVFFYAKILDREYGDPCARVVREIAKGEIEAITSVLAIVELVNALRKYNLGEEAKDVVDALFSLDMAIYDIDSIDVRGAVAIFEEFKISPYDCIHAAVMKKAGITSIISADREFDKINWIKRINPRDY